MGGGQTRASLFSAPSAACAVRTSCMACSYFSDSGSVYHGCCLISATVMRSFSAIWKILSRRSMHSGDMRFTMSLFRSFSVQWIRICSKCTSLKARASSAAAVLCSNGNAPNSMT